MVYTVLNKQDFEHELDAAADKLVVIDFYANWCGPCKVIEPQLQELSSLFANKAKFLKVNVEDCEDIAIAYNITCMPTFVFMKDRQIIDIVLGGNADKLIKKVGKYVEAGLPTGKSVETTEKEVIRTGLDDDLDDEISNAVNITHDGQM